MNISVLLTVLCFFFLIGCKSAPKQESVSASPRPVKVAQVKALGTIRRQYTGVVKATESSILAFKVPGTLIELNIEEGQKVKRGELIARVNPYDYELEYQTATTNYNTARSIYERTDRMHQADATALQNLEITQADFIRAESAKNIAQRTLDYTRLLAPFDGIIEKKYAENYEEVLAGQAIARLVNPHEIEVEFILPETSIQLLQLPKKIYVEFDTQKGRLFVSEIKEYVYASNGAGIPVILNITDQEFAPYQQNVFPGFSCKVIIELENDISNSYLIPESAVFIQNGQDYVWIVDPQTKEVEKRPVTVRRIGNRIFVTQGINSADLLVTAGVEALHNHQQVSLLP